MIGFDIVGDPNWAEFVSAICLVIIAAVVALRR